MGVVPPGSTFATPPVVFSNLEEAIFHRPKLEVCKNFYGEENWRESSACTPRELESLQNYLLGYGSRARWLLSSSRLFWSVLATIKRNDVQSSTSFRSHSSNLCECPLSPLRVLGQPEVRGPVILAYHENLKRLVKTFKKKG